LEESPDLPRQARSRARALAGMAREAGLETSEPAAAVVPVVLGPPHLALAAANLCAERGIRVGCFRPPSVPRGRSSLRLTARADLRSDDLAAVRGALTAVAELKVDT
jgi:7-keto-8-aminopelargonate synthetase-like enzyme